MLPTLKQHALITAALVASMTLSACGSKKDVFKQPEQPKLQSRPMSDPSQQQQGDNSKDNSKKDNKPLPLPLPPKPGQQQPGQQLPKPKSPVPQSPKPVDPSLPAPLPDDSNSSKDSTKKLSKRATGGVSEDGLIYTSSAPDNLLEFLRARNERVDENSRQANLKAAASVVSAKLILDGSFGEDSRPGSAIVSLKIQEGRDEKIYNLSGDVNDNNAASFLRSVGAANGQATTGTRAIEGTLKCLDLDGLCKNVFVRLRIGSTGSSAIINVVFRNSFADLYFEIPGTKTENPEFQTLREYFRNTILREQTENKIKRAVMSSYEVVNGRSGVALTLKGENGEFMGYSGPLLAPEAGTRVNIGLSRIGRDQQDSEAISWDEQKFNYANWIGDARMVANDGAGDVKIALKIRKRSNYSQETFLVTFIRKVNPIIDITDENLR